MKYGLMVRRYAISIVFLFLFTGIPTVLAIVEPGWPAGQPNTPRSPEDIFLDFEEGIEGVEIESTQPSLEFTSNGSMNWSYGDKSLYNVYPYGSQSYETNGNFFAWLGVNGDQGRIDFVGGGATYCSVLVSTYSGVTLEAYDNTDTLIATSGWATSNISTRTLTRLTVESPSGKSIAYVIIHDTGNYWLMDDLCTDADKAVIPVPGRSTGKHSDRFDLIFVPDEDYGDADDIDTWLPTFIEHIQDQIDDRLGATDPVAGNLDKFNFYYTKMQGNATDTGRTLPSNLTRYSTFADAYAIFHTEVFGDAASGSPSIYSAEGPITAATQNGRSFIHESGHGIFGLADEYDGCGTFYFSPNPNPNIWATEALGRADAASEGWDPDDIWMFTTCQGDWWKLGTTEYIMFDGTYFSNGWGDPGARRIRWFLEQYPNPAEAASSAERFFGEEKSIWMDIQINSGVFSLLDETLVIDSAPDYLPGEYEFTAEVFSTSGILLGEFGINDPRRILAEWDYQGPTWLENVNFQLLLPYFSSGGRVDLIESETGSVLLSVDISEYSSGINETPVANAGSDQTVELTNVAGTEVTLDGSGSSDPDGDSLTYEWTWDGDSASGYNPTVILPMGLTMVTLTVSDGDLSDSDTVDITVVDTTAPEVVVVVPVADSVIQDVITLKAQAADLSEITGATFSIRERDGAGGTDIGFDDLSAAYNGATSQWEYLFDSLLLPDGDYVVFASAVDEYGNEGFSDDVSFSIDNWVKAAVNISPTTINRDSHQRHILACIRLPKDIGRDDIDPDEPILLSPGGLEAERYWIVPSRGKRGKQPTMIFAFFDKDDLMDALPQDGKQELKVVGRLINRQYYYGCDTVKIIDPPRQNWGWYWKKWMQCRH